MNLLRLFLVPSILVLVVGCGASLSAPPPLEQANAVAVTPFIAEEEAETMGKWVPINLTTRFELALRETNWVYDQSEKVSPVATKLKEMGLTLTDIFTDPALAAKVGQGLDVDLIIVGKIDNPKFKQWNDNVVYRKQGSQGGISGTADYLRARQSALVTTQIKIVDTKTGELIFDDKIVDYLKYWHAFQVENRGMVGYKSEKEMMADLGNHLPRRIAYALYPTGMPIVKEGEVLKKPENLILLGSGGEVTWN
ncbi:MAG: hypothetical protein OXN17_02050 [Candidatus Poribacteria bacterium]|nr:hypothetical protein [Candidatus Poribacteria bacterium]MDE0503703.1 hypothetical protein [Candidatus Poribacteria bacterium]